LNPPCFIIALKDNAHSLEMLDECNASAKRNGWRVETFWGVNGTTITEQTWLDVGITPRLEKPTMGKLGVQGCFLSHYYLWQRCVELNRSIIILEHDAVINAPWQDPNNDQCLIKLHRAHRTKANTYDEDSGNWTKSGHAYYLNPVQANTLILWAKTNGALPTDILIGDKVLDFKHLEYELVSRNERRLSTTQTI